MEGQRRFRGFRLRNICTKEYKYGTSGPRRRRGEPGEGFGKNTAQTTFSSTPTSGN